MYPRNFWYVSAWSDEVKQNSVFRRVVLDEPLVFYRTAAGMPVVLEDRCCHRHMPLSAGNVRGDNIECGYHGLVYDPNGICVHIPSQKRIPPSAKVRAYPAVERFGWIWVWMGDPSLADPSRIYDFSSVDDPDWIFKGEVLSVPANYQLVIDNLLDLTHVQFVHPTTLGTSAVAAAPIKVERDGDMVKVTRWVMDSVAPPFFRKAGRFAPTQNVDRWQIITFRPPSFIWLDIGCAVSGTGALQGDRRQGITLQNYSIITPETAHTSHYFWTEGRNFSLDEPQLTDLIFENVHTAFLEDLAVVRDQDANWRRMPGRPQVNLAQDAGTVQARLIVDRILASEQKRELQPTTAE